MESNQIPPPYALAMVICDFVWRDPYTGKTTIIGTFSTVGAHAYPLAVPVMSVYTALTDGRGRVNVKLELVDGDELREPIVSQENEVEFDDPRAIIEYVFCGVNVIFPSPGEYRLKLFANNEFLMERRIIAIPPPNAPTEAR